MPGWRDATAPTGRYAIPEVLFGKKKPVEPPSTGELPVYMDPVEFSQLRAILHSLAPERCLEWGSGGSTRAILEDCPFVKHYVSVEHHREWYEKVRALVTDPRLSLHHVAPDRPGGSATEAERHEWDMAAETDLELLRSYVEFPKSLGQSFDFVLVDGRARCFCLRQGFELLRPGGVIVLHDAQRVEYHAAAESLGHAVFLEPWKQGQICLVRKG